VVYDGNIAGESDFIFLFSIDGSFMSNFQPGPKIFAFQLARTLSVANSPLDHAHFWITFNSVNCLRVFASNSDRQCIPYATQMRTSVAVRSVFPKAIGMNMNMSKCGSVENDASAKSRKDYLEN
jgi:hypothetical protein